jgi:hypothetical protein
MKYPHIFLLAIASVSITFSGCVTGRDVISENKPPLEIEEHYLDMMSFDQAWNICDVNGFCMPIRLDIFYPDDLNLILAKVLFFNGDDREDKTIYEVREFLALDLLRESLNENGVFILGEDPFNRRIYVIVMGADQ